jgi:hypothetical protein
MVVHNKNLPLRTPVIPVPGDMGTTNFCDLACVGEYGSLIFQWILENVFSDDRQEVARHGRSL